MIVGAAQVEIFIKSTRFITKISANIGEENSDLLSVTTNKDLDSPAGSFQIVLVPKSSDGGETWFSRVEVWDFVEISFKGIKDTEKHVTMRGLVDNVQYTESFEGGIPQRTITISGRDLGSLLTDFQIYLIPIIKEHMEATIQGFGLLYTEAVQRGLEQSTVQPLFEFAMDFFKKNYLNIIISGEDKKIADYLKTEAQAMFPELEVGAMYWKQYYGSWLNVFTQFQDKPFHELFVYDTDRYSTLILRPSRYQDARGKFPERVEKLSTNKNMYPDGFSIYNDEKISMTISKTIQEVKSYFITYPNAGVFGGKQDFWSVAIMPNISDVSKSENPYIAFNNVLPSCIEKFGIRPMEVETIFNNFGNGQTEQKDRSKTEQETADPFIPMGEKMNKTLVAWFLHNPLLLNGAVDIAGTNRAIVGTYMRDEDEGKEYYVYGVTHNFQLFQSYRTSLQLKRGIPFDGLEVANRYFFPV